MLSDNSLGVRLLATDVRESILQNLSARFRQYSLPLPEQRVLDASDAKALASALKDRKFQGIICDVPCTGSGTWARTPESCYFFKPETLEHYTSRQQAILRNAAQFLAPGGRLVYITCSVFRAENEDVVQAVAFEQNLELVSSGLINGIAIGSDSLYAAQLRRGSTH
jgi:16S rRNA (cytosine967-C5)-methyltransferase